MPSTTPRKRSEIPFGIKKKICEYKVENPMMTWQSIQDFIAKESNMVLGKSTINDILKAKEKWMAVTEKNHGITRVIKPKRANLEEAKRRRMEIPQGLKKKICEFKAENPTATWQDVRDFIAKESNLELGKSTVHDILRAKEKWLAVTEEHRDIKRARHPKYAKLEEALWMWLCNMEAGHAPVKDSMLIEKAKQFGEKIGLEDFSYSQGWLYRFKGRRGLKRKQEQGESNSAGVNSIRSGTAKLAAVLKDYHPDDVFNLDETGLFFRMIPDQRLAKRSEIGTKKSKARITVALAANASGTQKIKAFVITKWKRPGCFGKKYNPETYVRYRSNQKAWMTSALFLEWLEDFNSKMREARRRVILLVDIAASHIAGDLELTNVKLHFLDPNTSAFSRSRIQRTDAGIFDSFKAHYRKLLVKHYVECVEQGIPQTVDIRQAIRMVKTAWDSVTKETVTNCFKRVKILPHQTAVSDRGVDEGELALSELTDNVALSELRELLRRYKDCNPDQPVMSAEHYVAVDTLESTGKRLDDSEIIKLVSDDTSANSASAASAAATSEGENDLEELDVTLPEAKFYLTKLIKYFEQGETVTACEENSTPLRDLMKIEEIITRRVVQSKEQTNHD